MAEIGSSSRGNQTRVISPPAFAIEPTAAPRPPPNRLHGIDAGEQEERVRRDATGVTGCRGCFQEGAEHQRIHAGHHQRLHERPTPAEKASAEAAPKFASSEVEQQFAKVVHLANRGAHRSVVPLRLRMTGSGVVPGASQVDHSALRAVVAGDDVEACNVRAVVVDVAAAAVVDRSCRAWYEPGRIGKRGIEKST